MPHTVLNPYFSYAILNTIKISLAATATTAAARETAAGHHEPQREPGVQEPNQGGNSIAS